MSFRISARLAAVLALPTAVSLPVVASDSVEEVVVVANRIEVASGKVGNSVSVITAAAIRDSQAISTADLLATVPGVGVTRDAGPGTYTAVRIRGAESEHTLVLVDGVQINDPASPAGGFDFGNLLVGDINRIEVLRGAQSTLYGSQAIGGVVNILTATPAAEPGGKLQAEYGSMGTTQFKGGIGGHFDRLTVRAAGTYLRTDGISTYARGEEEDSFRNTTLSARLGYAFSDAVSLDLRGYHVAGKISSDGYLPDFSFGDTGDYTRSQQLIGYAGLNFALGEGRMHNRVAIQHTRNDRDLFFGPIGAALAGGKFRGENRRYEYQGSWKFSGRATAVFGLQRENSQMRSDTGPEFAEVALDSAYLQVQAEVVDGVTLTAGNRYDDHETFGSANSPQLAAAWSLPGGTVLRGSWSKGFKSPTLYQLFSDYSNPLLRPETSTGWDLGAEQRLLEDRASVSATYFNRTTRNQISYLSCPFPPNAICSLPGHSPWGYYENTARTAADGVELQASVKLPAGLDLGAGFTHMRAIDRSPGAPTQGLRLLRRPDNLANMTLGYHWADQVYAALAVRYASSSMDVGQVRMGAYTLVDLRASWAVTRRVDVAARVENLFDEQYETIRDYGTVGRAGYVSLAYHF